MTGLWILCGVLLFLALILFTPIGIELRYDGEIGAAIRVLCFRYRLMPKKKKKIKLRKYSKKNFEKMLTKEKKKAEKKAAKKSKKADKKEQEEKPSAAEGEKKGKKSSLVSDLWDMRSLLLKTVRSFIGRIRTERMRVRVVIGSDNAAKSALIYGAASNVAVDMQEILRTQTNLRRDCEIALGVDFTSDKTVADVYVRLAVTVASVIATGFGFIVGYFRHKKKS